MLGRLFWALVALVRHGLPALLPGQDRPLRLRRLIEDLGGSFLKFGQMLALQPDVLPQRYCDALFDLMDRVTAEEFGPLRKIFIEEHGKPPEDCFDSISLKPLATASIGQVHRAVLKGREVVVKIQRPNAAREVAGDLRIMKIALAVLQRTGPKGIATFMAEFIAWTYQELDYRVEARYMKHIRRQSDESVHIPEVFDHLTSKRTMTVSYLDGVTLLQFLRARTHNDLEVLAHPCLTDFDERVFARNIVRNFLVSSFQHGLFHADLHPANLMIMKGNTVGYVDFGITGVLSRHSRHMLVKTTLGFATGNLSFLAACFFQVCSLGPRARLEVFRDHLQRMGSGWYRKDAKGLHLDTSITQAMLSMLLLSRKYDVWPEHEVIKYVRSAIALDGLFQRFAPEVHISDTLTELANDMLRENEGLRSSTADQLFRAAFYGGRLITQADAHLEHLAALNPPPVSAKSSHPSEPRLILLSIWVVVLTAALALGHNGSIGINMFTAQVMVLATSLILLIKTILRPGTTKEQQHA